MKTQIFHRPCLLLTIVGLVACQSPSSAGSASASTGPDTAITLMPVATATATTSLMPSPTSTVTKTPYPSTPISQRAVDIYSSPVASDLLYSGDNACKLPCWYGLRAGESNVEQIQAALRQALGVSEDFVFIMGENPKLLGTNAGFINYGWQNDEAGSGELFGIETYFNPQTDILGRLQVSTTIPNFLQRTMAQRAIRELGAPSSVKVNFSLTERAEIARLDTIFVYMKYRANKDILVSWSSRVPVQFTTTPRVAMWCLNGNAHQVEEYFLLRIALSSTSEVTASSDSHYQPLEQVFNITPEELYERVIQEDNTCLTHEF